MFLHIPLYVVKGEFYSSPPGVPVVAYVQDNMCFETGTAFLNGVQIKYSFNNPYAKGLQRQSTIRPRLGKPVFYAPHIKLPSRL